MQQKLLFSFLKIVNSLKGCYFFLSTVNLKFKWLFQFQSYFYYVKGKRRKYQVKNKLWVQTIHNFLAAENFVVEIKVYNKYLKNI